MKTLITCALLATTALPGMTAADELTEEQIKELVYEAIRENPGIVMEAVAILERSQQQAQENAVAKVLNEERDRLEQDPNAIILGNPDGDVTVVEFFDYNCPYCRRVMPEVDALVAQDPNVRLVYREWPILGEGSDFAARAALASRNQGLYEEFHVAMMSMDERAEEASVLRIAREVGLDVDLLVHDMDAPEIDEHISTSMELTRALGFSGTPSFVIGDALIPGYVEAQILIDEVDNTRAQAD